MIFLGAGASAPFGINTSKELTDIMRQKIKKINSDLLSDIDDFYKENVGVEPDFEMMLTQLSAYTSPTQVEPTHYSLIFKKMHPEYQDDYSNLIDEMYGEVRRTCTSPFIQGNDKYLEPEKLEEVFTTTYDALFGMTLSFLSRTTNILIFSTNYDPSIEIWSQKRNMTCIDGTKRIENPEVMRVIPIDTHIQMLDQFNKIFEKKVIGLVRLHGSVWTYKRSVGDENYKFTRPEDRLLFPDLYERMRTNRPSIIFPGQEDYLRIGRWDKYYQFFKKYLIDKCLFIGYSFRHTVINEQIRSSLETNNLKKLGIFAPDPDKLLNNLFRGRKIPENKIVRIKGYFGEKDSLWVLNKKWFGEYFGRSWQYVNQPLEKTKVWQKENRSLYL